MPLRFLLPLLGLLVVVPAHALPAEPPVTLAPDAEARWVPFTLTPGNQIRVDVDLDGRTVGAIVDTGVSVSLLSRHYAESNRLPVRSGGTATATAIGGNVALGWTTPGQLTLGGIARRGGRLTVIDLPAIASGGGMSIDLLIGRDLLAPVALEIDYQAKRLRFLPSGRMPFVGSVAPLSISPKRLVYVSQVALAGQRLSPMLVDTGDGAAITLAAAGWHATGLDRRPGTTAVSYGVAGAVVSRVTIVPALAVGDLTVGESEVRGEPVGGFSETIGMAGRIGNGFLQHYRVLLDPGAGRMVLKPEPDAADPPLRSTSGLLVGLQRDRLKVIHVMSGGPAEAAGWKLGDTICRVDGTPVGPDYAASPLAAWSIGAPGRVVALGMCDGTTRQLTLRRFY